MTYTLYLGDRSYSSWSLRAWLLCDVYELPVSYRFVDFAAGGVAAQMSEAAPARTVPTLKTPDGAIISESLAIAEELASRFPDAPLWPADPKARAIARTLAAEMHSGFQALRAECPMNLRVAYEDAPVSDAVSADLERIETIWREAREAGGVSGPWLCGSYSIADAFYAPVAMRIAGYDLPVSAAALAYVALHLEHLPFRRWRARGLVEGQTLDRYRRDYPTAPWPGPPPRPARAVESGAGAVNAICPYSGGAVTDFLEMEGRVYGFCNPGCRDKTVADPEAWPAFMAIVEPA
ncbi:MAG: glutathione S-transferase [Pseudomonadota bacterium]